MVDHGAALFGWPNRRSAETAGDVFLRPALLRRGKNLGGLAEFHQLAKIHEGGILGEADQSTIDLMAAYVL